MSVDKVLIHLKENAEGRRGNHGRNSVDTSDASDASRLRKVLSKDPGVPAFLMNSDGSFTKSSNETLELLMTTHFPGCKDVDGEDSQPEDILTSSNNVSELVVSIINKNVFTRKDRFTLFLSVVEDVIVSVDKNP